MSSTFKRVRGGGGGEEGREIPLLGLIYVVTGTNREWREKLANKTLDEQREKARRSSV